MARRPIVSLAGVLIVVMGLTVAPNTRAATAPARSNVTVEGIVTDIAGSPIPGAFVRLGGVVARTHHDGHYRLTTRVHGQELAVIWAPRYVEEQVLFTFPSGSEQLGTLRLDFTGSAGLSSALVNPADGASLAGLPITMKRKTRVAHLRGTSSVPLESRVAVTLPDGRVATYPLHASGATFSATVPFRSRGAYRVEINSIVGIPVFNLLVFRDVAPFLPADPAFPADPPHIHSKRVREFALGLLNEVRAWAGVPAVHMQTLVLRAAQAHNDEMARLGYIGLHPHLGADSSTPWMRVHRVDPRVRRVGEVVAREPTVGMALLGLLDSPSHRAVMLGPYRWVGIAAANVTGGVVLTIDFAS